MTSLLSRRPIRCGILGFGLLSAVASPLHAQKTAEAPEIRSLLQCRGLAEPDARLACFDRTAEQLDSAIANRDVVMLSPEKVAADRRADFGHGAARVELPDVPQVQTITGKITRFETDGSGLAYFRVEGHGVWRQVDGRQLFPPRAEESVTIDRTRFGGFRARIGDQPSFRAVRVDD